MKSSPLRRWLREERARENAEALAAGVDIAPTGGPIIGVDLGTPWPSLRPGHPLIAPFGFQVQLDVDDFAAFEGWARRMTEAAKSDPDGVFRSGGDPDDDEERAR